MKDVSAVFTSEKNKSANKPIFLYTIHDYDGAATDLCLAEAQADVTFDSITYTKFPIKHSAMPEHGQGETDRFQVTLCNVSRVVQAYLETYDWRGKQVDVTIVWANQLAEPEAYLTYTFYIDSYTTDENNAVFSLPANSTL